MLLGWLARAPPPLSRSAVVFKSWSCTMAESRSYLTIVVTTLLLALVVGVVHSERTQPDYVPQQIRLSYGSTPSEMRVTWASGDNGHSLVMFGLKPGAMTSSARAESYRWEYGNANGTQWVHRAKMKVRASVTPERTRTVADVGVGVDVDACRAVSPMPRCGVGSLGGRGVLLPRADRQGS